MTTYALLELGDDGRVSAFKFEPCGMLERDISKHCGDPERPVASGTDRGQFRTFEIGRYSIDVVELPVRKERT